MNKKLVRHGNSLALIIDKPLLKLLDIDEDSTLELEVQGEKLILQAARKKKKAKKEFQDLDQMAQEIMDEYEPVFKKLSKT